MGRMEACVERDPGFTRTLNDAHIDDVDRMKIISEICTGIYDRVVGPNTCLAG